MVPPILTTGTDDVGRPWVQVRDTELFDFVEDELVRNDLEYLYVRVNDEADGPCLYTMTFSADQMQRVEAVIWSLELAELRRIYEINNPTASAPGTT